ncbi:MAG: NAD(P)/FAD-dependent oxidoreductase [Haloferacaceae archaeon]
MNPVVVVGGGIVGTSVASHLARRSVPVHLLEQNELGSGTSADSMAVFVWQQTRPDRTAHRLRQRSWDEYGRLVDEGTIDFERTGTLHVAHTQAELDAYRAAAEELRAMDVPATIRTPEDLADDGISFPSLAGGLYTPDDGYLDTAEIIQHFAAEARDAGAAVETGVEVTDVAVEDGSVTAVETTEGRVPASAVVNAAGPWAPFVDDLAGVSLPLRHNFGPILVLQSETPLSLPFLEFEDGYYLRPEGDRQVFAGRVGAAYEDASVVDPAHARSIDHEYYLAVEERLAERFTSLPSLDVVNEWVGLRTVTPDGRPFVGRTDVDGFYVACGMSGYGVTLAPAVGQYLAALVDGDDVDDEFRAFFEPDRA